MPSISVRMMSTQPVLNSWWRRDGACLRRGRRRSRRRRWAKRYGCGGGSRSPSSRTSASLMSGSSQEAMPMRRCPWRREWPGYGPSTAALSKGHTGLVTRSARKGRAVLNWPRADTATAHVWHGYCVCMAFSTAAGVLECGTAMAALSTGHDRVRRARRTICWNGACTAGCWPCTIRLWPEPGVVGAFDDAEPVAYSSVVRFDAQGEVWYSVEPLNILPGIAEARGDLDGASATYEALVERCEAGQRGYVLFILMRLASLAGGQGGMPQPTTCMTRRSRCAGSTRCASARGSC